MGYAKHVGRVGALAVALGIGAAVATTPGVAWADGDTDNPAVSDGGLDKEKPESNEASTPSSGKPDPGAVIRKSIERAADDLRDGIRKVVSGVARSSGGAITSSRQRGSNSTKGNVLPDVVEETPETPKIEQKSSVLIANNESPKELPSFTPRWRAPQSQSIVKPAPKPVVKVLDDVKDVVQQAVNNVAGNQSPTGSPSVKGNAISTLDAPPPVENAPEVRPRLVAPVAIMTNVLNAAIAPFLNPTPGQPAPQNPILWAVLSWVRRQVQDTPFGKVVLNRAPVGTEEPVIGLIDGTDNLIVTGVAADPDGDDIETVGVTNGAHGTVRINDDGSVTYDPDDDYTGPDSFTVTVSDETDGFHVHGVRSLFSSDGGHTTTVEVNVLVEREDSGPLIVKESGAVEKTVTVNPASLGGEDPANYVGRTYSTQFGTATITGYDADAKTYTVEYRPNANLRLQGYTAEPPQPQLFRSFAALSAAETFDTAALAPTTDRVTITVGEPGNQQTISFDVPITQSRLKVDTAGLAVDDGPTSLAVNQAGTRLYVLNNDSSQITVFDTATNTQIGDPIILGGENATAMKLVGNHLYVLRAVDNEIDVIDVENDANSLVDMEAPIPGETEPDVDPLRLDKQAAPLPGGMAVNDAGTRLYILNSGNSVSVVDVTEGTQGFGDVIADREITAPSDVGFASSIVVRGDRLYLADFTGGSVRAIDLTEGAGYGDQIGAPIAVNGPFVMAAAPDAADHDDIYILSASAGTVAILDRSNNQVTTVKVGAFPSGIAFSPDGSLAYIAGQDSLSIIDTSSRTFVLTTVTDGTPEGVPGFDNVAAVGDFIYLNDRYTATSGSDIYANAVTVVSFFAGENLAGPQLTDVDMGDSNQITGAVPIRVAVEDQDGDAMSVIVTQPANGRVVVTPNADGSYTVVYTPTGQARMEAFDTAGDQTDTFVVAVTDGDQFDSQTVTVTVSPAESGVTETRPWDLSDGFIAVRGAVMAPNGDILLTVLRPDSPVQITKYSLDLINTSDPSQPTPVFDINSSQSSLLNPTTEDVVVVGNRTYVLNGQDKNVAVFDENVLGAPITFNGGQPIGLFTDAEGDDAYALVAFQNPTDPSQYDVSVVDLDDPDQIIGVAYTTQSGFNGSVDGQFAGYVDGAVGNDGRIYVTDVAGRSVSIIDNGTTTSVPITGGRPLSVAANPDNGEVYVTIFDDPTVPGTSTLRIVDVNSLQTIATITTDTQGVTASDTFSDMVVSPDGSRIYVTVPSGRSVAVIDTVSHAVSGISVEGMGAGDYPARIVFANDASEVYVIGYMGTVSVVTFADTAVNV